MKTAVEWLVYMYALQGVIYEYDIDKAIEMEKEQIVNAVDTTIEKMNVLENFRTLKNGEQYYNETFKEQ
jgi:hypothetical protein